jgi:hypothetical protein
VARYRFLSPEWIEEARRIQAEYQDRVSTDVSSPPIRVNLVITDVPGSNNPIQAHFASGEGQVTIDLGHLDDATATITLDHATAQALFVEGDMQAGIQAFWTGKIQVSGDLASLITVFGSGSGDPIAGEIGQRLRDITEPVTKGPAEEGSGGGATSEP